MQFPVPFFPQLTYSEQLRAIVLSRYLRANRKCYLSMGLIDDELQEVQKLCEHLINGSRLVSCVQTMVRVEIKRTNFKLIVACIQFPDDYPNLPLLLELKSKTISEKLLDKLTNVCEKEARKYLGKPQVLKTLQFVRNFIDENPLSCCYDEISVIKESLNNNDEFKLKQKNSCIIFKLTEAQYYLKGKIIVPDDYPVVPIRLGDVESNFSPVFNRFFMGQAKETARQCVEPPLMNKKKPINLPYKPKPSLMPVLQFLVKIVKTIPKETCQICHIICLPKSPQKLETDESASQHIERVYCGHLFHLSCLIEYMKTPPFQGGKKCPSCGQRIYHEKWKLSDKLAEDRWAHQQARERELKEVEEFFQ